MSSGEKDARARCAEMLKREWKHVAVALAVVLALTAAALFKVPNPSALLLAALAMFTALWGYPAGIACALFTIVCALYAFSTGHGFAAFTRVNLQNLVVVALAVALITMFVGQLKKRYDEAAGRLRQLDHELSRDGRSREAVSTTDALTGLRNRFALRRDYSRFENRDVHVMMMDLDDFRSINDRFGRSVGDHILKKLSAALVESFGGEWCYRYGGDEFLVVLPDVGEGEFLGRLEGLKRRVQQLDVDEKRLPVHFSAGYVHGACELSYDLRLMIHQADSNLYDAKGLGKDCYVGRAFSRVFAEALPEEADGFGEK